MVLLSDVPGHGVSPPDLTALLGVRRTHDRLRGAGGGGRRPSSAALPLDADLSRSKTGRRPAWRDELRPAARGRGGRRPPLDIEARLGRVRAGAVAGIAVLSEVGAVVGFRMARRMEADPAGALAAPPERS